jgi:hypothetical protein
LDEKTKHAYIETLQSLQKNINFLQNANANNQNPSLEKTINTLRNSQNKLYGALVQHGVTPEETHKIIMENNDKQLVSKLMKLQSQKDKIEKQLADPNLSPKNRQTLEHSRDQTKQAHADKWNEIINSPRRAELIHMTEHAITKKHTKSRNRTLDRNPDHDHTLDPDHPTRTR